MRVIVLGCFGLLGVLTGTPAAPAETAQPTGAQWQQHCRAWFKAVDGDAKADDLDVTYCVGMTAGIVAGMRLGSQIGALSMASTLAVDYRLDTKEVFAKFQSKSTDALLQVCPPADRPMSAYIRAVDGWLRAHPERRNEPVAQVVFEALQDAWRCPQ